ncbi:MAG: STAS domain-containing protein [Sedimentisphaerales bacterium]|nr:STAS domain-containing protein [Sedimentisphaerales bacterium]
MKAESILVRTHDDVTIIDILEENILEMEETALNELAKSVFAVVERRAPVKLILQFGQVKYFSTSVLGMLVMLKKKVLENNGVLKICRIHPSLNQMLELTKLNTILEVYPDEQSALHSFLT